MLAADGVHLTGGAKAHLDVWRFWAHISRVSDALVLDGHAFIHVLLGSCHQAL